MKFHLVRFLLLLSISLPALRLQAKTDSLKKALLGAHADTLKIAILSDLCFAYANSAPDSAMAYLEQQKQIADRLEIPKYNANVLNDLAVILYYKSDYTNALINNKKALEIREAIGDKSLIISSLNKIAVIYQELGSYELATNYQLQVLKIAEELKNDGFIAITLNNISYLYQKVKKYNEALTFARRSYALSRASNDTFQMAVSLVAMEGLYEAKMQPDSALACDLKAIAFFRQVNALSQLATTYNDIGYLYRAQKNDVQGIYYYRMAYAIAAGMDSKNEQAFYAANLGAAYMDHKMPDSAYYFLQKAMSAGGSDMKLTTLRTIYSALASYYIIKAHPDSALHYNELYRNITDTMYSSVITGQVNELLLKYETEKKEQQIILLNEQNKTKQLSINRGNIIIGSIICFFIMTVILAVLFYNRYRLRQEAAMQEEIIRQQQLASKAVIAAEELERQRIAHDLHDGIGQMFSAVKMNLSGIADRITIPEESEKILLENTLKLVDESCKEVRAISHQMMPNVLLKMGLSMAIRDFIDKIDESKLKVTLATFGLQQPLDPNVETVLYRVIQESVNNVIKHARASMLDIQLHKDSESITATIEDNGIGFDTSRKAEGIGLKSIAARVAFLNGKVDYDSAPDKGTLVAIYIPYNSA